MKNIKGVKPETFLFVFQTYIYTTLGSDNLILCWGGGGRGVLEDVFRPGFFSAMSRPNLFNCI